MAKAELTTSHIRQAGFSVVEVLLAAVVFGMMTTGLIGAIVYGRTSTASAGDTQRAQQIAEEGIEAVRSIGGSSFASLVDNTSSNVGDTAIEAGFDNNANGTSCYKVTTGASGGTVSSMWAYIKTVDATNPHVQMAIYADASGTPGALLGASATQNAVANSWNSFSVSGVTVTATTNYWIALSEDGNTQFADGSGGVTSYDEVGAYPAANPYVQTATAVDKPSFYMSVASTGYGLTQASAQWAFSGASDITDIFTRQITISTAGTNRKLITSTVTWPKAGGGTGVAALTTRISNWRAATKLWTNPVLSGAVNATGTNDAIKTKSVGDYNYTVLNVATTNNFIVTNITNPAAPVSNIFSIAGTPTNIFVVGNYAYVTNQLDTAELQVVDITNPAAPTVVKSVDMIGTGNATGVYVSNGFAYVTRAADATASAFELTIVNVATPSAAAVVGGYNNDIAMNEVTVIGTNAYIATSSTTQEMLVVNAVIPAAPVLLATYNPATTLAATTISSYGNTVLLGMSTTLSALNVTTPTAPALYSSFTAAGTINDIEVDTTNTTAFLGTASTTGEFQIVNVTTPTAMTLAKTVDVTGTTSTAGGVGYSSAYDTVMVATASDTQELLIYSRN
jgi:Tfp pilus assembly protein PilV